MDLGGVAVIPRAAWGSDLPPAGPVPAEPDVRYLLVHHSVDPGNDYSAADVPGILRGFVRFHTSGRGWPDLAYNFLVDRFGGVWEGRTGSLAGPVEGSATGGNQGFDQLCCFIGNHQAGQPTPEAFTAMGRLLGALAARYRISLAGGATATFVSRGSNRHPAGTTVTTPTIAGHRDMSRTQCPGDLVAARLPELRLLAAGGAPAVAPPPPTTAATTPPATTAPPATTDQQTAPASPSTSSSTSSSTPSTTSSSTTPPSTAGQVAAPTGDDTSGGGPLPAVAAGAAATVAVATGVAWARRRGPSRQEPGQG